jgi:hypothetical protein
MTGEDLAGHAKVGTWLNRAAMPCLAEGALTERS